MRRDNYGVTIEKIKLAGKHVKHVAIARENVNDNIVSNDKVYSAAVPKVIPRNFDALAYNFEKIIQHPNLKRYHSFLKPAFHTILIFTYRLSAPMKKAEIC